MFSFWQILLESGGRATEFEELPVDTGSTLLPDMLVDSIGEHVYTVSTLKVIPDSLRLWRSRTVVISISFSSVLVHWPSNWIAVSSVLFFFSFLFSFFFGFPIQSTPIYSLALPNIHDPKSPCAIVCAQGSKRIGSSWALPLFLPFFSFSFFCIHTHVVLHLRRFSWALISISLLSAPLSLFPPVRSFIYATAG